MRTTITINDQLLRRLKQRAIDADMSMSQYIESAVKHQLLEDVEDLEDAERRIQAPVYSFDELVKEFKAEGLL